jgi:hypothetical protein
MIGFFDESGDLSRQANALFLVLGVWAENDIKIGMFMRKWLRRLKQEGYRFSEVKGSSLCPRQRLEGLKKAEEVFSNEIRIQMSLLAMNDIVADYRLFWPRRWSESEIHQAILYEMMLRTLRDENCRSARIAIDARHSLPPRFFERVQSLLRTNLSLSSMAVFRDASHRQKGIQLADVLCNHFYPQCRSFSGALGEGIDTIARCTTIPSDLRIFGPDDLLACLHDFQESGGYL